MGLDNRVRLERQPFATRSTPDLRALDRGHFNRVHRLRIVGLVERRAKGRPRFPLVRPRKGEHRSPSNHNRRTVVENPQRTNDRHGVFPTIARQDDVIPGNRSYRTVNGSLRSGAATSGGRIVEGNVGPE